jgi:hypothetical protein
LPPPVPTYQLIDLYKIAIEEYRFEVKLNWDRTVFYFTLNSGLIAIATGLLRINTVPVLNLLVAAVFFVGFCVSSVGVKAVRQGHSYYRRTIVKKTLIEDLMGLTVPLVDYGGRPTLAIGTTGGQSEHLQILHHTEEYLTRGLRPHSVVFWIVSALAPWADTNS